MSNGYFACDATITTWEKLRDLLPEETETFLGVLSSFELDVDEWHRCERHSDTGNIPEENWAVIDAAWEVFSKAFEKATTIYGQHLTLEVAYRRDEDREPYDTYEASGGFFMVGNVFHRTGAALRHHALLIDANWVEYG